MTVINTQEDFVKAIGYLQAQGDLPGGKSVHIDANARTIHDNEVDVTPSTTVLEAALDDANVEIAKQSAMQTLQTMTREEVLLYFREQLADAAGDGAIIADLYTQARTYEQDNQMLTDTMLTLRTIEETVLGVPLVLTTNAGKAQYLKLFLMALALWS